MTLLDRFTTFIRIVPKHLRQNCKNEILIVCNEYDEDMLLYLGYITKVREFNATYSFNSCSIMALSKVMYGNVFSVELWIRLGILRASVFRNQLTGLMRKRSSSGSFERILKLDIAAVLSNVDDKRLYIKGFILVKVSFFEFFWNKLDKWDLSSWGKLFKLYKCISHTV